ncbi:MAG TPA: hypothetical protein VGR16_14005 [Thermomicrobiales bacterium]|nr:hypothetical protein [Thermomicrobiales bacterium]
MRARFRTRLVQVVFSGVFSVYVAAAIIWLAIGLTPALIGLVPAWHEASHRRGGGETTIALEVSDWNGTLEQRKSWAPWAKVTRELTFQAGAETIISFQNNERGEPHNLSIYRDTMSTAPIFRGETVQGPQGGDGTSPRAIYRIPPLEAGMYVFQCDFDPSMNGVIRVVDGRATVGSPAFAEIAHGIGQAVHISEPIFLVVLQYLFSLINLCLGIVLVRLRPHDWSARLLAVGMVGTAATFNLQSHSVEYLTPVVQLIHEGFHWVSGASYAAALLLFPDGRLLPRWPGLRGFRWPAGILYLLFFVSLGYLFGSTIHGDPGSFLAFFGVVIPIVGITSQAVRSRRARSVEERQQSRVLVWALALPFAMALIFGLFALVAYGASSVGPAIQPVQALKRLVFLIFPPLFAVIPIVLFAIMVRYRLWEIDRVINRALVYGLLTGILGVIYLTSVIAFGTIVTLVVGQHANNFVVAGATLVVAALFGPVRQRLQGFIDRRFERAKYDAAQTLASFGGLIGDEVDLQRLNAGLLTVVEQTLQPDHVALWLRPPGQNDGARRP